MGLRSLYNPIIGFPAHTEAFTFGGGSWTVARPVSMVGDLVFAKAARSTDAANASTIITATSTAFKPVRLFGIAAHNMTLDAEYKLTLYSDVALATELYTTGRKKVWPSVYNYAARNWYTPFFWTGQYSTDEIEGQIPFLPILLPQLYNIKGLKLELFDDANPDGYVEVGYFEIAEAWQISVGIAYNSQYGYQEYTQITDLRGGLDRTFKEQPSYVFDGEIPALPESEIFNNALELRRRYGIVRPFIWMPYPTRQTTWLKTCKMVKLRGDSLIQHVALGHDKLPISVKEYKG